MPSEPYDLKDNRPWVCLFDKGFFTEEQAQRLDKTCPMCGGVMTRLSGDVTDGAE